MVLFTTQKTVPVWLDCHAEVPEAERPTFHVRALTRNESFAEDDDFDALDTAGDDFRKRAEIYDRILARRVSRLTGFGDRTLAAVVADLLTVAEINEAITKAMGATRITPAEKKSCPLEAGCSAASSATTAAAQASA